jgi:hypothetical protein
MKITSLRKWFSSQDQDDEQFKLKPMNELSLDHEGKSNERAPFDHLLLAYCFLFDWDKSDYSTRRTLFHKNTHHRSTMR